MTAQQGQVLLADEVAVHERDELHDLIAEGHRRGFLTVEQITARLEEMQSRHGCDSARLWPRLGRRPGASQVTALLPGNTDEPHPDGSYRIAFRAILKDPWLVRLVEYSRL